MQRAFIFAGGFLLLTACGGGGGGGASLPSNSSALSPLSPGTTSVTLALPADPNGSMIAGISDALVVGSISTSIASVPLTIAASSSAATTSGARSISHASSVTAKTTADLWKDGPGSADLLKPVLATLQRAGANGGQTRVTQSLPSTVGSQATFWVQNFAAGVPGVTFEQVPETLALQTTHANVWVQNSLTSLLGNAAALNTIGSNIETAIASDAAHFGGITWTASAPSLATLYATCDANGNRDGGSSPMWIVPADWHVNFVYVAPSEIGVGAYMDADSLMPDDVIRCTQALNGTYHSNQAPTIVLSYYGDTRGMTYVLQEDSIVHPAHEYQHLVNIVHHSILQSNLQFEDPLLNEGLSMMAQDFAISAATGGRQTLDGENILRSTQYLAAPQNYSVAGFAGVQSSGGSPLFNCATCYSPAWLLERYLYDRFGGDAYVQGMESGTLTSWPEVQTVTGTAPQTLLHDFAVALGASNTTAASPPYSFNSVNLHATYVDQLGDSYTLSGPAPLATLNASTAQTFNVLVGAFAYFSVPPSTAGSNASLSTGANSAFNLNGFVLDF